jgi:hypothetical protein
MDMGDPQTPQGLSTEPVRVMGDPQTPQGGLSTEPVSRGKTWDWQAFKSPLGDLGVKQKMDCVLSPPWGI